MNAPQDFSISLPVEEFAADQTIFNIKLTEELVEKLMKGQKDLDNLSGIKFCISAQGNNDVIITLKLRFDLIFLIVFLFFLQKLIIGNESFQFMKVKETQPVHVLSNPPKSNILSLLGSVNHKLNPKFELEASKAEAIRQRSQEAEKERLARKTVELDVLPGGPGKSNQQQHQQQKRLITRKPSTRAKASATNTTITRLSGNNHTRASVTVNNNRTSNLLTANNNAFPIITSTRVSHTTPPETPETPSPKKQISSANFVNRVVVSSAPASAKKPTTAKDRLSAIMKRRRS